MKSIHVAGNTYVLDFPVLHLPYYKKSETEIILLDTGLKREHETALLSFLEEENLTVSGILCTHAHIDHVGNAAWLKEKYGCPIALPKVEAEIVSSLLNLKIFYGTYPMNRIREHFGHMVIKSDRLIEETETEILFQGVPFSIIHTPGHSAGHIAITTPDDVTYIGDALISEEVMRSSKLPYAHILSKDLMSKMKLYHLRSSWYILAHKGIYTDIKDLITDNIYFYKNRAEEILKVIEKPMTFEDILKSLSRSMRISITTPFKYIVVERMLRCYIEYLEETGKITLILEEDFLKYTKISH
ncbi:MBL fold metallo-hydrolase [Proteiniclasticum sp.]|uniref:MBL fold metallo-hydrolase n=1 Tax=Proteiniclasticum sp. TaxID=2053595 RepID=UPI0028A25EE8|nr:MBL fold metallo-hydrolase [Proteiniclasticum sp.]